MTTPKKRYNGKRRSEADTKLPDFEFIWGSPQAGQSQATIGTLTIVAENMTSEDVDRAIGDAEEANTEIHIKYINSKVFKTKIESPKRGGGRRSR